MMPSVADLKSATLRLATNLRSWKTRRKIIVFESDDWGAIRMRDRATHRSLVKSGIPVDRWKYDSLDCLENQDDLLELMAVLAQHGDSGHSCPKFTMNVVMGNPDFDAIRQNDFLTFKHRNLWECYEHYHGDSLDTLWIEGVSTGLFKPQFHAREHLNSYLWLKDLRAGHEEARIGFEHEYYGMITQTSHSPQKNYLAAYWPTSKQHLEYIETATLEGLSMFENFFGERASTLVPCNYVWPMELERTLSEGGVKHLQGQRGQVCPVKSRAWSAKRIGRFTGQSNNLEQTYGVRNVLFEPFSSPDRDWCGIAMAQIEQAFRYRTPAIISTHRVNYCSGVTKRVRDQSLRQLSCLLDLIKASWPNVEFLSSDELARDIVRGQADPTSVYPSRSSWQ